MHLFLKRFADSLCVCTDRIIYIHRLLVKTAEMRRRDSRAGALAAEFDYTSFELSDVVVVLRFGAAKRLIVGIRVT